MPYTIAFKTVRRKLAKLLILYIKPHTCEKFHCVKIIKSVVVGVLHNLFDYKIHNHAATRFSSVGGVKVSIVAFQAIDPGSIPG